MAIFVRDTFTAPNGTRLLDHTGEVGASWMRAGGATPAEPLVITGGRVTADALQGIAIASGTTDGGYSVEADVDFATNATVSNAFIYAFDSLDDDSFYYLAISRSGSVEIWRQVSGGLMGQITTGSAPITVGVPFQLRLEVRPGSQRGYVDDVLIVESQDTQLSSLGRAGLSITTLPNNSVFIDNFTATALAPPSITLDTSGHATGHSATDADAVLDLRTGGAAPPTLLLSPGTSRDTDGPVTPDIDPAVTVVPGSSGDAWDIPDGAGVTLRDVTASDDYGTYVVRGILSSDVTATRTIAGFPNMRLQAINPSRPRLYDGSSTIYSPVSLPTSELLTLAVQWTPSTMALFVNGELWLEGERTYNPVGDRFDLGAYDSRTQFAPGVYTGVVVYDGILSDYEIAMISESETWAWEALFRIGGILGTSATDARTTWHLGLPATATAQGTSDAWSDAVMAAASSGLADAHSAASASHAAAMTATGRAAGVSDANSLTRALMASGARTAAHSDADMLTRIALNTIATAHGGNDTWAWLYAMPILSARAVSRGKGRANLTTSALALTTGQTAGDSATDALTRMLTLTHGAATGASDADALTRLGLTILGNAAGASSAAAWIETGRVLLAAARAAGHSDADARSRLDALLHAHAAGWSDAELATAIMALLGGEAAGISHAIAYLLVPTQVLASVKRIQQPPSLTVGRTRLAMPVMAARDQRTMPVEAVRTMDDPPIATARTLAEPPIATGRTRDEPPLAIRRDIDMPPLAVARRKDRDHG